MLPCLPIGLDSDGNRRPDANVPGVTRIGLGEKEQVQIGVEGVEKRRRMRQALRANSGQGEGSMVSEKVQKLLWGHGQKMPVKRILNLAWG